MLIIDATKREIVALYKLGGFDSEAIAVLCAQVQGFHPHHFAEWLASDEEFRLFIEDCRVLAQAWYERKLRESIESGKSFPLPAWYAAVKGQGMGQYAEDKQPLLQVNNYESFILAAERAQRPLIEAKRVRDNESSTDN